jgi:Ca-activated chloride channel family protein
MRKTAFVFLSVLFWLVPSIPAQADGMILPEALSRRYVAVRYHHVTVRIEDGHAVTHVEQEFYNPYDVPITGQYLFPLPPEVILSRFEATVDGRPQAVIRQDREATNVALYEAVTQQRDPSLLQYADWESLAFDLVLPPGGSRVMVLEYEEVLAPSGGLYRYRYVLSTERYSSQPLEEASVTVDLHSSAGLASVYSPSHEVHVQRQGPGRVQVSWSEENTAPTEDFELFFAPAEGGVGGGLLVGERAGYDHFLFLFSPEAALQQSDVLPKDLVLVLDRSGSMSGTKLEQARDALHFILEQLGERDRFAIISFNENVLVWEPLLQPVEERTLQDAHRALGRLSADGSTDLEAALQAGLKVLRSSEQRRAMRQVVFLTDGLPTAGITDSERIASLVAATNAAVEARLHVFGVGYDVNTHLLDRLAAGNGGTVTYVQPGEDLEHALTSFYDGIAQPLLTDVQVEFDGMAVEDVYPERIPDLFQGSSLLLAGRYQVRGDTVAVRVSGRAGEQRREVVFRFRLSEARHLDFVPRLWATRRVGVLLDRVRVQGETEALVDEIRALGLGYGLVTPYTTFVIDAQMGGAASAENMELYGNQVELNRAWGQVTIQARVQNQAYQQAVQANLALGANVHSVGAESVALIGAQQVDLSLLLGHDPGGPITEAWLARHVQVDRIVEFGSEEYFALAAEPEARAFLQSGRNALFAYQGQIVRVLDADDQAAGIEEQQAPEAVVQRLSPSGPNVFGYAPDAGNGQATSTDWALRPAHKLPALLGVLVLAAGGLLAGLLVMAGAVVVWVRSVSR